MHQHYLPNCKVPVLAVGKEPNKPVCVVGVAKPVGLLKFNVGWVPNKLGDAVLVAVVPSWKLPVVGWEGWVVLSPKVGWVWVAGVPKVILELPKVGGAAVLKYKKYIHINNVWK